MHFKAGNPRCDGTAEALRRYVQFIPCLDVLGQTERSPWTLTPRRFFEFYRQLFPLWAQGVETGRFISVKLFDNLINQYLFHQATACGVMGHCVIQNVIEANGDIFPCDFYVLDQYKIGAVLNGNLTDSHSKGELFFGDGQDYVHEEPAILESVEAVVSGNGTVASSLM